MGTLIASLVCGLLLGCQGRETKPMGDQEKIQGTWAVVSGERNGTPLPAEVVKQVKVVFAGQKMTTKTKDRSNRATFKLDPTRNPKEIDVDMEGNVGKGIYELDGGALKIAHGEIGDPRPKEFPRPGSGLTVLVLKRER